MSTRRIALFRGLNVGGRNRLPMADLRAALESVGCDRVRTLLQSGNAVFDHPVEDDSGLATTISKAVAERCDIDTQVLCMPPDRLAQDIDNNPFPEAEDEPASLHLWFFSGAVAASADSALETLRAADERFRLDDGVLYLHAPSGIARSKLVQRVDRALGVSGTGRNWRTSTRLLALANEDPP